MKNTYKSVQQKEMFEALDKLISDIDTSKDYKVFPLNDECKKILSDEITKEVDRRKKLLPMDFSGGKIVLREPKNEKE